MNESPICFGVGKNQFGRFDVPSSGKLASVKLVRLDGYVKCNNDNLSFWGCGQDPKSDDVNVEIRDSTNGRRILPSKEFVIGKQGRSSLRIPGYNPFSPELVLSANLSNPPNVTKGHWLRLSHREDRLSFSEREKTCCDVYARFII